MRYGIKHRILTFAFIMVMAVRPAIGQIIFTEEDVGLNKRAPKNSGDISVMVPVNNIHLDQYTQDYVPIGDNLLLLGLLGGGYLLKKKKEEKRMTK